MERGSIAKLPPFGAQLPSPFGESLDMLSPAFTG